VNLRPTTIPATRIGGRLTEFREAWERFTDDQFAISVVTEGVKIQLDEMPVQDRIPARQLSADDSRVISHEVESLLERRITEELPFMQTEPQLGTFVSPFFTLPKANGKRRAILDLSEFNEGPICN